MNNSIPFFNIIRLPEGKETEVLEVWKKISDFMEASEGCISTRLHRNLDNPRLLINNAHFADVASFVNLTNQPEFLELSAQLTELGVEREAGIYEVIHTFSKE